MTGLGCGFARQCAGGEMASLCCGVCLARDASFHVGVFHRSPCNVQEREGGDQASRHGRAHARTHARMPCPSPIPHSAPYPLLPPNPRNPTHRPAHKTAHGFIDKTQLQHNASTHSLHRAASHWAMSILSKGALLPQPTRMHTWWKCTHSPAVAFDGLGASPAWNIGLLHLPWLCHLILFKCCAWGIGLI